VLAPGVTALSERAGGDWSHGRKAVGASGRVKPDVVRGGEPEPENRRFLPGVCVCERVRANGTDRRLRLAMQRSSCTSRRPHAPGMREVVASRYAVLSWRCRPPSILVAASKGIDRESRIAIMSDVVAAGPPMPRLDAVVALSGPSFRR
jgi:glycerol-3-phosphate dehydrogenase